MPAVVQAREEAFLAAVEKRFPGAPRALKGIFPGSSLRAREFSSRSQAVVVPASSQSLPVQNPRSEVERRS
eukprot:2979697-Pyramimonas_sp.AAC.1